MTTLCAPTSDWRIPPIQESRIGELSANFDIILGVTPEDNR
jgi:hypothetical protein